MEDCGFEGESKQCEPKKKKEGSEKIENFAMVPLVMMGTTRKGRGVVGVRRG